MLGRQRASWALAGSSVSPMLCGSFARPPCAQSLGVQHCLSPDHTATQLCCPHILIAKSPWPHSHPQRIPTSHLTWETTIKQRINVLLPLAPPQRPSLEPKPYTKPHPSSSASCGFLKCCPLPHQVNRPILLLLADFTQSA